MIHGCIEKYAQNENHIVLSSKSASKRNWLMFFWGMLGTVRANLQTGNFLPVWLVLSYGAFCFIRMFQPLHFDNFIRILP